MKRHLHSKFESVRVPEMRDFRQKEKKKNLPQNKPSRDEPCLAGVIPRPWSDQPIQGTWRR